MQLLHNALSGVAFALAIAILALLSIPGLANVIGVDLTDRLPMAAGLLALCALLKPYVAERALMSLVHRHMRR